MSVKASKLSCELCDKPSVNSEKEPIGSDAVWSVPSSALAASVFSSWKLAYYRVFPFSLLYDEICLECC